jgi:ribonuclease BN (tRNA processing enzyme)
MGDFTLTPLGTNGFIPTHGRQTMSYLVRRGGRALLLDAGTGLARLLGQPLASVMAGLDRIDLLLTHYHLDHTVGLSYLTAVAPRTKVRIWAPAPPLVDGTPAEALGRLIAPPLFPIRLEEFPAGVELVPYAGEELEVAGLRLRLRRQRHAGGSVGVVLDGRLGYLTDCEVDEGSAAFARGLAMLLHEVWVTDEEAAAGVQRRGHSTVAEVARLADQCGVGTLVPIHHHPTRDPESLRALVASLAAQTRALVVEPEEGREYAVP